MSTAPEIVNPEQTPSAVLIGSSAGLGFPPILDACCGSRKFWFDHEDGRSIYMDRREDEYIVDRGTPGTKGRAPVIVKPQVMADFTAMPFPDETFWHVVFDPPHYTEKSMSTTSKLAHTYGMLVAGWEEMLTAGFKECFRVLKPGGTLVFKWCSTEIPLTKVLSLTPHKPLYGHRTGKKQATHWVTFWKPNDPKLSHADGRVAPQAR
jgi:SAM-dependent methyltransferase